MVSHPRTKHTAIGRAKPQFDAPRQTVILSVAENDTAEFRRQAAEFFAKWHSTGTSGRWVDMNGLNHYSVLDALVDGRSELGEEFRARLLGQD